MLNTNLIDSGLIIASFFNVDEIAFNSFLNSAFGYLITVIVMNCLLLCVFFFFNKNKTNTLTNKFKISKLLTYLTIATTSYFCLNPIVITINILLNKLGYPLTPIPYNLTTQNYFISLFSLVLIPAVCEELLFRGIIFKGLKKFGKPFSIILSAIMFTLFHMSIEQLLYPFLMGLMLKLKNCL